MSTEYSLSEVVRVGLDDLDGVPTVAIDDGGAWRVVGEHRPLSASRDLYVSRDQRLRVGVARYDRVTLNLCNWDSDVFMYIFEGEVEISDELGNSHIFGPNSAFVVPKGFKGTWKELSDVRKIHVIYT